MNLLFTSAGRRGYLLDYFKAALKGKGEVHAANSSPYAPAFLHADKSTVTPLIYSEEYIDFLLEYCARHAINAIIPLFDIDIPVLAKNKSRFADAGVTVIVSNPRVADICNDKLMSYCFLLQCGLDTPRTYADLEEARHALDQRMLHFPLVIKPRWGMGSIGLYVAEDSQELGVFYGKVAREIERSYLKYESAIEPNRSVLIQQMVIGIEYGLDVVNDLEANHVATFVKQKLTMRSGETDSAVTVDDSTLLVLGRRISASLGHIGNLDVDVMKYDEKSYVLELNARFGGGYPFSHLAGADVPRAIVTWLAALVPEPDCFNIKPGVIGMKDISVVGLFDTLSPE